MSPFMTAAAMPAFERCGLQDRYRFKVHPVIYVPYFHEFFLRVLLISERTNMQVQSENRNKTRASTINIAATLPCSCVHYAPSRFSPNEYEMCT